MVTTSTRVAVPPEVVWEVLSDPAANDHLAAGRSTVTESVPPRRLVLDARIRPFGRALVEFTLTHSGSGTALELVEGATAGPMTWPLARTLGGIVFLARNRGLLRRIRKRAEL